MFKIFNGVRARRLAEEFCRERDPNTPIHGSAICADEPGQFVVRVFCGDRPPSVYMLPPWATCVIVAVDKATWSAEQVLDDAAYQPILR